MSALDLDDAVRRLRAGADAVTALVSGVGADEARWKPAPDAWSILEVMGHLGDEERLDFRTRLDLTLNHPGRPWPPIDPEGWVREKHLNDRVLTDLVDEFRAERDRSISWLRALSSPDWSRYHEHPTAGRLTAPGLLYAWIAHDLLHVRQIMRLRYRYVAALAPPGSLDYAGAW